MDNSEHMHRAIHHALRFRPKCPFFYNKKKKGTSMDVVNMVYFYFIVINEVLLF